MVITVSVFTALIGGILLGSYATYLLMCDDVRCLERQLETAHEGLLAAIQERRRKIQLLRVVLDERRAI